MQLQHFAGRKAKLFAAEGVVLEAHFAHALRRIQIAPVDHQFARHDFPGAIPIEFAEHIPLRANQRGIGVLQSLVGVLVIVYLRKERLGARHPFRVGGMHDRAFFKEALDDFERGSEADVVGVGLEGQPEDSNALALHHPKRLANFFKKTIDALSVDAFGGLQDVKVHADGRRQVNESLNVLRETETSIAEAGLEELSTDTRVEAHGMSDFFHVGADFFAEIGNHVGITDFQREKGIRGVLDELGAVDGGNEKLGFAAWREKIRDGGAFAKKFGIGSDAEFDAAFLGIGGKSAAEFEPSARGDGAFLDDELGGFRFGGDLTGHVVDGRKVGLAGILRRSAHADEDGVSGADGFTDVGSIGNPSGLVGGRENLAEMMFVDRNAASVELSDALAIDVRTHYLVSCFGKTSSGDEPHVSTADN